MQLDHIAKTLVEHLLGRLIRQALIALVVVACTLTAFYQFTIVGQLALQAHGGAMQARLIVGGIYAAVASIALGVLWWQRRTNGIATSGKFMASPRDLQIVMLIEAVMLGYELASKAGRVQPRD